MTDDDNALHMHIGGAPDVDTMTKATQALKQLVEGASGARWSQTVILRCDADGCDTGRLFDLAAGEQAVWDAARDGWTRDQDGHYCPEHSQGHP